MPGKQPKAISSRSTKTSRWNNSPNDFAISSKVTRNTEVNTHILTCNSVHQHPHRSPSLGLRPFGVSLLYAGYDPHYQFQLYHSDPSGNYSGWKATCVGANNGTAQSLLKQDYKDDINLEDAIKLIIKVMGKTMDSTTLSSEKCAFDDFSLCPSIFDC